LNFAQHLKNPWIKVWNHWGSLEVNNAVTLIMVNSVGRCIVWLTLGNCIVRSTVCNHHTRQYSGLGIRGTQVKSSIQDIMDEVAPIKKAPL
jgi:hypothetical protein